MPRSESYTNGMPVQRSLALNYSNDNRTYDKQFQHQYLFGPFIMVAPVESDKEFVKVFFPEGNWYYLYDGKKYKGDQEVILESPIHKLPVFIKAGAIIPMQRAVQNTKEVVTELILHVYNGDDDTQFELYEDDGSTFEYEKGVSAKRLIRFSPSGKTITLEKQSGSFKSLLTDLTLVLHGFGTDQTAEVNGKSHKFEKKVHSLFLPLEKYDPINDPDSMGEETVLTTTFAYSSEEIVINL